MEMIRSVCLSWMIDEPFIQSHDFNFIPGEGSRKEQLKIFRTRQALQFEWHQTCEALSTMRSLSNLQIILESVCTVSSARDLLKPLLRIRDVEDFEVILPSNWSIESVFDDLDGDLPFAVAQTKEFEGWNFTDGVSRPHSHPNGQRRRVPSKPEVMVQRARRRLEKSGWI